MTTATTLQWRLLEPFRAPKKGDAIPVEGEVSYGARGPMCHASALEALRFGRGVVACLLPAEAARDAAIQAHPDDEAAWAAASRAEHRAAEARAEAEFAARLRSLLVEA